MGAQLIWDRINSTRDGQSINLWPLSGTAIKDLYRGETMFEDRTTAGEQLAEKLSATGIQPDVIVAIPRGGLPIGRPIADTFDVPLEAIVTRKISAPFNPEIAIGAITSTGASWLDKELIDELEIGDLYIEDGLRVEEKHAREIAETYPELDQELSGKTVVLVDDGITTGTTVRACLQHLQQAGVENIVLATPIIPKEIVDTFEEVIDDIVYLKTPDTFLSIGQHYKEFRQLTDEEAVSYMEHTDQ